MIEYVRVNATVMSEETKEAVGSVDQVINSEMVKLEEGQSLIDYLSLNPLDVGKGVYTIINQVTKIEDPRQIHDLIALNYIDQVNVAYEQIEAIHPSATVRAQVGITLFSVESDSEDRNEFQPGSHIQLSSNTADTNFNEHGILLGVIAAYNTMATNVAELITTEHPEIDLSEYNKDLDLIVDASMRMQKVLNSKNVGINFSSENPVKDLTELKRFVLS